MHAQDLLCYKPRLVFRSVSAVERYRTQIAAAGIGHQVGLIRELHVFPDQMRRQIQDWLNGSVVGQQQSLAARKVYKVADLCIAPPIDTLLRVADD